MLFIFCNNKKNPSSYLNDHCLEAYLTYLFRREICISIFFFTSICGPILLISISLLLCYLWCLSFPFRRKTTHLKRNISEKKIEQKEFFGNVGELETIKFNLTLPMFEKLLLLSNGESHVNLKISKSEYLRVYYD